MAKSKTRKDHKKRIAKRKDQMLQEKRRFQKFQQDMLMRMINSEKEGGKFEGNPEMPGLNIPSMTQINIPSEIQGPQI
jgi:hypothetical protein